MKAKPQHPNHKERSTLTGHHMCNKIADVDTIITKQIKKQQKTPTKDSKSKLTLEARMPNQTLLDIKCWSRAAHNWSSNG